jgi:release factor glutamine methyltransferase
MLSYYKDIKLETFPEVYGPLEDSFLFAEVLEEKISKKKYDRVLEIGCGSGILSLIVAKQSSVVSVDINLKAVEITKKNAKLNDLKVDCFVSDMFEKVKGRFDMIIFNSPYLPDQDNVEGNEMWSDKGVIKKFISSCRAFLNSGGEVLLLISSLSGLERIEKEFKDSGFGVKVIKKQKIAWEELMVLEAKPL